MAHSSIPLMNCINIIKPEQSGKTFEMIKIIIQDQEAINFIFCDNSLLLTSQTTTRVDEEVITDTIEFSSRAKKNKDIAKTDMEVVGYIMGDNIKNVICCTNGKRVENITKNIKKITK